jgi:hypothetical protein
MTIDELLRETVHGLAREARPPVDLVTGAMVQGRRLRRRRRVALTAAAVALVGTTAIPYAVRNDVPAPAPAVQPTTGPQPRWWETPVALPGGWLVTGLDPDPSVQRGAGSPGAQADALVLDRRTGRYRAIPQVRDLWPAPRGSMVAFSTNDRTHTGEVGVLDTDTGRTEWVDDESGLAPQWSPDGRRLLLTTPDGFAVYEVSTRRRTAHAIDQAAYRCTESCLFTWQPDGVLVSLPIDDLDSPEPPEGALDVPAARGVQLFATDTGLPVRLLPTRGDPEGTEAWSPGGRYVLLRERDQGDRQLVEVSGGRVVRTLPQSSWAGARWFFVDDNHLLSVHGGLASSITIEPWQVVTQVALPTGVSGRVVGAGAS